MAELKLKWGGEGAGQVIATPGLPARPPHIQITATEGTLVDVVVVWPSEVESLIEALKKAHRHLKGRGDREAG